jgi:tetratricopeptide (TPR) repeat protein
MRAHLSRGSAVVLVLIGLAGPASPQHAGHQGDEAVGRVTFANSCAAAVQPEVARGLALLHSFWFPAAISAFDAALAHDPTCAIAWWGKAMSHWGNPYAPGRPPTALAAGLEASRRARALDATPRERAYIDAVATLYEDHATRSNRDRTLAYEQAMAKVTAAFPDDSEAAIFYALALTQNALPTDKTYTNLLEAGRILEQQLVKHPDHPGIAHYIIHSYDVPALADRALAAARRYAKLAPAVPHALHMPSHTFTRLGLWQESIETNLASAEAARAHGSTSEELHALDYQAYAYLQTGQDAAVTRIVAALPAAVARIDMVGTASAAPPVAGIYAATAIPARYAMERGDWAAAAALPASRTALPFADVMTYFARAVGAVRSGEPARASADIAVLGELRQAMASGDYAAYVSDADVARDAATAWQLFATGQRDAALTRMRAAAEQQDAGDKSAISPGPLAPARELLAEMLLEAGRPADALREFEAVLRREPGRLRSMAGAAMAAKAAGDSAIARRHAGAALEMCANADRPGRPMLDALRTLVPAGQ